IFRVHAAARPACEWRAYTRRKHRGYRRNKARLCRIAESARQTSRRSQQKDRRPDTGATIFSVVRRDLALKNSRGGSKAAAHNRSTFAGTVSRERPAREHAGISKGIQRP